MSPGWSPSHSKASHSPWPPPPLYQRPLADISGRELAELRLRKIGFIFQGFNLLDALDATDNVAAPAVINDPALSLADEHTANLDAASGYQVLDLLQDMAADTNQTVLLVTHDHRITDAADRLLGHADGVLHDRQADFATATDPVCGMEIIIERAATTHTTNDDQTLWFCSQLCAHKYDHHPSLYQPVPTNAGPAGEPVTS
jgi:ABC-type methionine transport system ATPase subunit